MHTRPHNPFLYILTFSFVWMLLLISIPLVSVAQIADPGGSVSLSLSPEVPGPDEQITATLSAAGVNIQNSPIVWFIDGEQVASGRGENRITFTTPALGESVVVRVLVNTPVFGTIQQSRTITPTETDLLWEAVNAYTPPFYKGKALPSSQEIVRIVAIPHLTAGSVSASNSSDLSYKWERNFRYRDFNNQSGYGAQSITYRKDLLEDTDRIAVEISSGGGGVQATGLVVIPTFTPRVLFYKNHPLYGTQYNRAYTNEFPLITQESTAVAEPYFFSVNSPTSLTYEWKAGGQTIPTDDEDRANELTFRTEGGSGRVNFSLSVTHPDYILQLLQTSMTTVFGEQSEDSQNDPFSL